MTAQVFQFPSHPAEQARLWASRPSWSRRFWLSLAAGLVLAFSGSVFASFGPPAAAMAWLGLACLAFSVLALGVWAWQTLRAPGRPWFRLLLLGALATSAAGFSLAQRQAVEFVPVLNALQWAFVIGMVLRGGWLLRRPAPRQEAAIWSAGATGEALVSAALAQLGSDYVVIHNLPLTRRGDADHVIVGPTGVLVLETKYLAGRISCRGQGRWTQTKRDGARAISDPEAQLKSAVFAVRSRLGRHRLLDVSVNGILVFAHPRAELDVAQSSVPVARPHELVSIVGSLDGQRLTPEGVRAVADALLAATPAA